MQRTSFSIGLGAALGTVSLAAASLSAGLLCGCRTDPAPRSDEIRKNALGNLTLPETWKAGGAASGEIQDNWLATFGDAQLEQLVAEAIANNPDLRVAATRVEQAAGYVEQARAALKPSVGVFGTGGFNMGGGDITSALQGLMLAVSWEPDLWGRLRYGRNAAEASLASVEADLEFARQSLAATTARSWFTATETWLQRKIAADVVHTAEQLVALAEKRREVGVGNEQDVAVARSLLGTYQDAYQQVDLAHQLALRAIELLLGRYPAAELQARQDLPALPGAVPAGMPLATLERRPDMIAAERRVAAAFHRVGEAKAARLPNISLNASASVIDSEVLQLQDDFSNPTAGAGARLIAPIYTGGALDAAVEIRTAEQKQAVAEYARAALRAIGDVENALAAGHSLAERERVLRRSLADNERALALAGDSFRVGRQDQRSVEQQRLGVHAARLALLAVQSAELSQRATLHLSLGGKFELPPTQPKPAQQ
jgi:NodT family efflux transporter outer membrane factor (OMF) lipoprotein